MVMRLLTMMRIIRRLTALIRILIHLKKLFKIRRISLLTLGRRLTRKNTL
jgi:hypothetical protein